VYCSSRHAAGQWMNADPDSAASARGPRVRGPRPSRAGSG